MSDPKKKPEDGAAAPAPPTAATDDGATDTPSVKVDPSKDLWTNILVNVKDAGTEQSEQTLLVCGSKNCGKTTLVNRLLGINAKAKPTTGLEYSHGKKDDRGNRTQVAHVWELAGGTEVSQLAEVVITPENVHAAAAMITVDCADPKTMWEVLMFWIKNIESRVGEIFKKMRDKKSSTPDRLELRAKRRLGEQHPDLDSLRLVPIPLVIVASRYDILSQKEDPSKVKTFMRTLRFVAHLYGASLVCTSENEREVSRFRSLLNAIIFQQPPDPKHTQLDYEKGGLCVPAGRDSFHDIGSAPVVQPSQYPTGDATLDKWKFGLDDAFPPKQLAKSGDKDTFDEMLYNVDDGFGEASVDAVRKQKDEELEQYRRSLMKKGQQQQQQGGTDKGAE